MKKLVPSGFRSWRERGQALWWTLPALSAFVAAMALATDIGNLYYNDYKLQTADDAAVLAGAHCLPGNTCTPTTTATNYATANGVKGSDTITGPTVTSSTVTMGISRNVPYSFARLAGVTQGTVNVSAEAQAGVLGTADNPFAVALQYCGTAGSSSCYTQYTTYSLSNGGIAPGSWDPVSISGAVSVGNSLTPITGCSNIRSEATAAQNLINAALSNPTYSGDTPASYVAGDPRLVTVPLVDWSVAAGRSTPVPVYGFAEFFLTNVSLGAGCSGSNPIIQGQFVNGVADGTITTGTTADLGAYAVKLIQ